MGTPEMTNDADAPSHDWMIVLLLSGAFVINYTDRQVVFSIFPLLKRDLGFTDATLGAAGTAFTWTYSLMMPFSGFLADRFPRHRMVMLALILWSMATLATGVSANVDQFLGSRILMGICESLYVPAAIGLITQAHAGETRSRALSVHGFAQFVGITLGGWFGGWSGEHMHWRQGFLLLGIVGALYAVVLKWKLRPASMFPSPKLESGASLGALLHSPSFLALCGTFFSFCIMLWMLYAWLPSFIYERYQLSLAFSGLTATLYLQASSAVGVLLGGWIGDLLSRRYPNGRLYVVIFSLLGCAPFAAAIFSVHQLLLLKIAACGFGLLAGSLAPNTFSSLYDVAGPQHYGLAVALINSIGGLGAGFAILLTGISKAMLGMHNLMYFAGALAAVCSLLLLLAVQTSRNHAG